MRRIIIQIIIMVLIIIGLTALWKWTPIKNYTTPSSITELMEPIKQNPMTPFFILGLILITTFCMSPLTPMIIASSLLYGATAGFFLSLTGALISAASAFFLGRFLWSDLLKKLAGSRWDILNKNISKRNLLIFIGLRIFPIAPFMVLNLVSGASRMPFQLYMTATLVGIIPGTFTISFFSDRIFSILKNPQPRSLIITGLLIILMLTLLALFRKFITSRTEHNHIK